MKNVSAKFKASIVALERTCKMRVTFDISDTTANGDVSNVVTSTEFNLSDKNQMFNKERESSYKLATWEKDRWQLDGSFVIPDSTKGNNGEVGWWSNTLCDSNGIFTTSEDITINFNNSHSSMGLTITFDTLCNEYATEFDIVAYGANGEVLNTENVTNNTESRFVIETQLYLYKKICIKIKKWSRPYGRARVLEIDFGVVRTYTDDNLISGNLIEEVDLAGTSIIPTEFKFVVYNINKEFNILNPKGFYKFLQQRQQVIAEIGTNIGSGFEYCKLGTYWLKEWQSDEGAMTATFTARDIIDLLEGEYENLTGTNTNLKSVAQSILTVAGINYINYEIDELLSSISTTGLVQKMSCRDALQLVAIAGMCNVYVKNNKLFIKHINIDLNTQIASLRTDNMYKEPQISLNPLVKSVEVNYYTNLENSSSVVCGNNQLGDSLKVDNTLIINKSMAENVGNWILGIKNLRALYEVNWQQNPSFDVLDTASVQNSYETKNAIITKQEYEYKGYLRGKTELIGGINIVS